MRLPSWPKHSENAHLSAASKRSGVAFGFVIGVLAGSGMTFLFTSSAKQVDNTAERHRPQPLPSVPSYTREANEVGATAQESTNPTNNFYISRWPEKMRPIHYTGELNPVVATTLDLTDEETMALRRILDFIETEAKHLVLENFAPDPTEGANSYVIKAFPIEGQKLRTKFRTQLSSVIGDQRAEAFLNFYPYDDRFAGFGSRHVTLKLSEATGPRGVPTFKATAREYDAETGKVVADVGMDYKFLEHRYGLEFSESEMEEIGN